MNVLRCVLTIVLVGTLTAVEHTATTLPGGLSDDTPSGRELVASLGGIGGVLVGSQRELATSYVPVIANRPPRTLISSPPRLVEARSLVVVYVFDLDPDGDRVVHELRAQPARGRVFPFDFGFVAFYIYLPGFGARGPQNFRVVAHDGAARGPENVLSVTVRAPVPVNVGHRIEPVDQLLAFRRP